MSSVSSSPSLSSRVFLLSPARLDGLRARSILQPKTKSATGALAAQLRTRDGASIGEVFRYLSGLYFRGKLVYANRFARPPVRRNDGADGADGAAPVASAGSWMGSGALVITSNRGLVPAETRITIEHLEAFAETNIHQSDKRFRSPLVRDAELVRSALGDLGEIVLLGSVAQAKYTSPLLEVFGDRLLFPSEFVGRGDMSRGGLLLRSAEDGSELTYVKVRGASLHGVRPPKLVPKPRSSI